MNERAFLAQLESANTDELTQILRRPTAEEERVLEIYFGRERLERLRSLALRTQQRATPQGNVVVLHGIMGGEMTVFPEQEAAQYIWLSFPRLAIGAVGWLRVAADLTSQFQVKATGILKKWYSEMILELSAERWNVRAFWFDWRLDLAKSAAVLHDQINEWFGDSAPVNLVAHSMGGLVSRTYILNHRARWDKGGKLIMLGTPNHGSFAIPQVITGALGTVRNLAIVDITHSRRQLCAILNTFPGSMQMLPSPLVMPEMQRMYKADEWQSWEVAQPVLDLGLASHKRLEKIVDDRRMAYIAGYNQVTPVDVQDWLRLDEAAGYRESLDGDGTVPHRLGFMDQAGKKMFPTYFVDCKHGGLANDAGVIAATKQLLVSDDCSLPKTVPARRGPALLTAKSAAETARRLAEEEALRELSRRVRGRTRAAGGISEAPVATDEIKAAELLVRDFIVHADGEPTAIAVTAGTAPSAVAPPAARAGSKTARPIPPPITIGLVRGGIQDEAVTVKGSAIAVGHYIGVAPQNAELALDKAISQAIPKGAGPESSNLLLTQLCRRGIFAGELGQNFFLPDPRDRSRVIVLAGMGQAGAFGEAELAVLARELVWTLGRAGRTELFTVLIGSGAGNLSRQTAVNAWLRGTRRALYDAVAAGDPTLERITFVEYLETNFVRLDRALFTAVPPFAANPDEPLRIRYARPNPRIRSNAARAAARLASSTARRKWQDSLSEEQSRDVEPIRLTVELRRDIYEFAALTAEAAIPQRETQIDPILVDEVNDQLPLAETYAEQLDRGHLLETLLVPDDLRGVIERGSVPVVLAVDATTARIHWEMLSLEQAGSTVDFKPECFLGARAGLTRQLRTTFAQLPEAPVLSGRALRVLVVADPAEDAPLPGAQEEGEAVAAIFEEFGRQPGRHVEVLKLFGPGQATRVAVLDQLVNHRFDILHYAGHCFFNEKDPAASGWVFSKNSVLSAHELSRIDRIPRFIFSNACESGITPLRIDKRNAAMAPSFAEAFFARGVANFVCTAWPVGDAAALAFARRVYRGALGLRGDGALPEAFHQAMAAARQEIARTDLGGLQTWGAYQHYGDPNFRFIPKGEMAAAPARPQPNLAPKRPRPTRAKRPRAAARRSRTRRRR